MYFCEKALLRANAANSRITTASVNDISVRTLVQDNDIAVLVLTHPSVQKKMSLDLMTVRNLIYGVNDSVTVSQWLASLGDRTLPTTDGEPKVVAKSAKFNDLFLADYSAQKVHPGAGEGSEFPEDMLTDILITKTDVDYQLFYDHCLVTVNGLLHLTDASSRGVTIIDGGRSINHSNQNQVGLISFREVGKIQCFPITKDHLLNRDGKPLKDGFNIHMPEVDFENKIVMLSVGGFLHFDRYGFKLISDHTVRLEWYGLQFVDRYYRSKDLIDLSDFNRTINRNPNHGDALDLTQALSDESIIAYMELSQTFLITLEAPGFYYDRHPLEKTGLIGRYYSYERPQFPLQLENGLMPSYAAIKETAAYVVAVPDNYVRQYAYANRNVDGYSYVNSALRSHDPSFEGNGYLLEMGSESLI